MQITPAHLVSSKIPARWYRVKSSRPVATFSALAPEKGTTNPIDFGVYHVWTLARGCPPWARLNVHKQIQQCSRPGLPQFDHPRPEKSRQRTAFWWEPCV